MQRTIKTILLTAGSIFLCGCAASPQLKPDLSPASPVQTASTGEVLAPSPQNPLPLQAGGSGSAAKEEIHKGVPGRQQIFVHGACLSDTGRSAMVFDEVSSGAIASVIHETQSPVMEEQANFDCTGAPYIHLGEGAAALLLDGQYRLFLADDTVEFGGIYKKKSQVSDDTLKWLDFYYSLAEQERKALSMVPSEFSSELLVRAMETTGEVLDTEAGDYTAALTDQELLVTEMLAQQYFTEDAPVFEGVDQIYPLKNDDALYHNAGLEGEYVPGNLIIYKVLTVKDRRDGNPFRFISIARKSKSDDWKIINSGY